MLARHLAAEQLAAAVRSYFAILICNTHLLSNRTSIFWKYSERRSAGDPQERRAEDTRKTLLLLLLLEHTYIDVHRPKIGLSSKHFALLR